MLLACSPQTPKVATSTIIVDAGAEPRRIVRYVAGGPERMEVSIKIRLSNAVTNTVLRREGSRTLQHHSLPRYRRIRRDRDHVSRRYWCEVARDIASNRRAGGVGSESHVHAPRDR